MGAGFRPWAPCARAEQQSSVGIDSVRNCCVFREQRIECQGRVEIAAHRGGKKTGALPGGVSSNPGCSLLAHVFLSFRGIGPGSALVIVPEGRVTMTNSE